MEVSDDEGEIEHQYKVEFSAFQQNCTPTAQNRFFKFMDASVVEKIEEAENEEP